MFIRKPHLDDILLPLCFLGFTGSAIVFLERIFTSNTRWIFLALLFLFLLSKRCLVAFVEIRLFLILFLYFAWCFLTSFWSNVPLLSFSKSGIFIIVALTMMSASTQWVRMHHTDHCLDYLGVFTMLVLLAGFLGKYSYNPYSNTAKNYMYSGLIHGTNMFGSLLAMAFPFLIWKSYLNWTNIKNRIKWIFLSGSCLLFLALSLSRSSILVVAITSLCFLTKLNINKKIYSLLLGLIICTAIFAINSSIFSNMAMRYIYKNQSSIGLLGSREKPWELSYNGAVQGGWIGQGYGVSYGQNDFNFDFNLSSVGYGREKGNSQLAIVEETGLIGLILYSLFICAIVIKLIILNINVYERNDKILVGIVSGIFLGMLAQSVFEAWWTSPGSLESVYFWTLVGVIRGLEIVMRNRRIYHGTSRLEAQTRKDMASLAY